MCVSADTWPQWCGGGCWCQQRALSKQRQKEDEYVQCTLDTQFQTHIFNAFPPVAALSATLHFQLCDFVESSVSRLPLSATALSHHLWYGTTSTDFEKRFTTQVNCCGWQCAGKARPLRESVHGGCDLSKRQHLYHCQANLAHTKQSGSDSGPDFRVEPQKLLLPPCSSAV